MRKVKFDLDVKSNALLCPNPESFYAKAYITQNVADNFRPIPGIKEATKIAVNTFDDLLKPAGCSWAPVDQALDAEDITVCKLDSMMQICQYDAETAFISMKMSQGDANWQEAEFLAHVWDDMSKEIEQEIQLIRWNGEHIPGSTASFLDHCDGYLAGLTSSNATPVTGTASITKDNIVGILDGVITALPEAVKGNPDSVRIYMSATNAYKYLVAVLGLNHDFNFTGDLPLQFAGFKISVQPGMDDKWIVAGRKEQFAYAFDGIDDEKNIKIVNMIDTTAEPVLRARVALKIGFKILDTARGVSYYKAK